MEFLHVESDNPNSPIDSLRVNWYYRPRDVQRFNSDSRLVYATMHSDLCPLTSLRGLCTIKHRSEIDDLDAYRKERDSFYFVQVFDRFIRRWYECIPTSQIINVPEKVKKALDERWKFVAVEIGRVKELTSAVKTCKRCTRYCASSDSVDCAICKNSYHMNCVQPPLPKKPSRGFAWACGPCSRASERKMEARNTPTVSGDVTEAEEEEIREEEELPAISNDSTRAPSPNGSDMDIDEHPATQAEIALAQMWPMRYLGIHCRVEDALQYDDRAIYPRASSRLGPRHQANTNVWHGRPVELVKPAEIKKRYIKGGSKKEGKLSKETLAAIEADRVEKSKRPKWVQDEPVGYVARGEDYPNDDPRCTAKLLFKMPEKGEVPDNKLAQFDKPEDPMNLVNVYLRKAKQLAKKIGVPPFGTNFLDKAVELFRASGYDEREALDRVSKIDRIKDLHEPVLGRADLTKFEEGVAKYGSEHRLVRLHMKTNLPNSCIVRFYYLWKKTPKGKEIWGNYPGRKGKKRIENDGAAKLHEEVAHGADDSAFDNDKAVRRKRGFQCKFCGVTHARQWRRAPGASIGQTVLVEVKDGPKDKRERRLVALCLRCAHLWRRYAIQWEDLEEVAKKVSQGGGRAWKRRIDEELLRELTYANELAALPPTPEPPAQPIARVENGEPPKKKSKAVPAPIPEPPKPKEKTPPPPKLPTPPPPPIIPEPPKWKVLPCAVCHTEANTIECAHCKLTVHRSCYGLAENEGLRLNGETYWVCEQCHNDRNPIVSTDYACCLCLTEETLVDLVEPPKVSHKKKTDRDREKERLEKELADNMRADYRNKQMSHHRPILPREPLKHTTGNNWVHVQCAVFTPEIRFSNAKALEVAEGFQIIPPSKFEAVCKLCKNRDHQNKFREDKGACVNCFQCAAPFHVSCAFEAGYQFGFDVTPVKGSRKDQITTATLANETGSLTAAIWCKEHSVKSIVHPMHEIADDSGRTALQVFVENYKQADLTLTGTVRKANQVQLTKDKGQQAAQSAGSGNRRESAVSSIAAAVRRGARSSLAAEHKPSEPDVNADATSQREGSAQPAQRRCAKCKIDVTPKWHVKEREPEPEPKELTPPKSPQRRLSMTLGEIADQHGEPSTDKPPHETNGDATPSSNPQNIRFLPPNQNVRSYEDVVEREPPGPGAVGMAAETIAPSTETAAPQVNGDSSGQNGAAGANEERQNTVEVHSHGLPQFRNPAGPDPEPKAPVVDNRPLEYLCHKCFVKRKLDPTPPPPSPPARVELSPPKTFPLRLEWNNGEPPAARPPPPVLSWEEQLAQNQAPPPVTQPPQMGAMGPAPGFLQQQPPPGAPQQTPNHGFPPTYHAFAPPLPHQSYDRPSNFPTFQQPPQNPQFHPGHRPSHLGNFPPPGQPMQNGINSPHAAHHQQPPLQSPSYPPQPHHSQFPPRRTESPFSSQLPPLGGPLYGSPSTHFAHPAEAAQNGQQQLPQQQQPQPPQQQAMQQPAPPPPPQDGMARSESQPGQQPSTPREQGGSTPTPGGNGLNTNGASASPSLRNLLS